jgi:hypothetical protein
MTIYIELIFCVLLILTIVWYAMDTRRLSVERELMFLICENITAEEINLISDDEFLKIALDAANGMNVSDGVIAISPLLDESLFKRQLYTKRLKNLVECNLR